jgi:hypothetical protein
MSCFTVANCWFSVWEQLHELMIDAIEAIIGVLHEDVDSRFEPVDLSFQAPEVFPHLALIAFQKQERAFTSRTSDCRRLICSPRN